MGAPSSYPTGRATPYFTITRPLIMSIAHA
jgi:hypothetical protein